MKYLFLHHNFPGQFRYLAAHLAAGGNEVLFLAEKHRRDLPVPGVNLGLVTSPDAAEPKPNAYMQLLRRSEAFGNAMLGLRKKGFRPDIVVSHCGFGCGLFAGDIFPDARLVNYFEWYYNNEYPYPLQPGIPPTQHVQHRLLNQCQLDALINGNAGFAPTAWQRGQYPTLFQERIAVAHEGVDTAFFQPLEEDGRADEVWAGNRTLLAGGEGGVPAWLALPDDAELVTYIARGLEPSRGFPQFWKSLPALLKERPACRVMIMGDERVAYDAPRDDGKSWLAVLREEYPLDQERVRVLPFQSYAVYRELLRRSALHVYLTVPFVLSWSLLEAMSTGCLVMASDTSPVREVVRHGKNGILVPADDPARLAGIMSRTLEKRHALQDLRKAARRTVQEEYRLEDCLARQVALVNGKGAIG